MALIDFILDLACLSLWLAWRSGRADPLARARAATLVGTLRRADPKPWQRWLWLFALALLLGFRGLLYQQIGVASGWTPRLDFTFTVVPFRTDSLRVSLLYSLLGFVVVLVVFYFWLLVLAIANRETPLDHDPLQRQLRDRLGRLAQWPLWAQLASPALAAALLWLAAHPVLVQVGLFPRAHGLTPVFGQALLVGIALFFSLKYLLPPLLLLFLATSYVYLGTNPIWDFVEATGRGLLKPLRRMPWHFGKLDFSPLVGAALVLGFLHFLPNLILNELMKRNRFLWPQ
jgi:uncharacterized protein YggT (Ycf19 family)